MKRRNDTTDSLSAKAEAAFDQASRKVVQRARQSGTPVIVWKDGHVLQIPGDPVELATVKGNRNGDKS